MGKKFTFNRATLIHLLCWGLMLALPLFLFRQNNALDDAVGRYLRSLGNTLGWMMIFYLNYFILIPKYFFENKRKWFVIYNILAIFAILAFTSWWWRLMVDFFPPSKEMPKPDILSLMSFKFIIMVGLIGLSVAIRMGQRWHKMQETKKEAERIRTDAELKNLRNQLNPHFLLNTLNNIYALIAFDPEKAQVAVGELSKLLRHALYDNQKKFVPLYKEAEFIENYISLMKMRVTNNVKINTNIDIDEDDSTPIAPLIFISLIENAFKHGISQAGDGEIDITITNTDDSIMCEIINTNHPKRDNDKSGSGIGLEQVAKRLELIYPDRYTWEKGLDTETNKYFSKIVLRNARSVDRGS